MRLAPRSLIWASAALLLGMIAAVAWLLAQEPPPLAVARLPNGAELRLEAVTYGERHQFTGGRRWQRLMATVAPSARRSFLKELDPRSRQTSPGVLLFWTSRSLRAWLPDWARFVIVDEHGCEFDRGVPWADSAGDRLTEVWAVGRFPRREAHVTLRIYGRKATANSPPLAEFTVPNPAPGPYPVWKPEPLPASRRDGDLTLTLTRLLTGLQEKGPVKAPWWRMGGPWSCATLRLLQKGRPSREWEIRSVGFTDATGNPSMASYSAAGASAGEWHFVCGGSLAPHETAWKVRAEYTRVSGFPATDLWTVKGVGVPGRGAIIHSSAATSRHGASLRLLGVAGPGAEWSGDRNSGAASRPAPYQTVTAPADRWTVHVQAAMPAKERWWGSGLWLSLARATDDRGRKVAVVGGSIEGDGRHHFELKVPPGAKRLDLAFAIPKSRYAEIVVRPARQ